MLARQRVRLVLPGHARRSLEQPSAGSAQDRPRVGVRGRGRERVHGRRRLRRGRLSRV